MSAILGGQTGLGLGNTTEDATEQAFKAADALKGKKEETAKTIEEGLGGLKVMIGGKGVTKAILDDPIVKKFGSQLKTKAVDAVKKAGQDAIDNVSERLSNMVPYEALSQQSVPGVGASTDFANPAFAPAEADQSELDSLVAKGASRLRDGENVFREGYDGVEDGVAHVTSGEGSLFRAGERASDNILDTEYENVADNAGLAKALPGDNLSAGEFGTEASGGMTEAELARSTELSARIASSQAAAPATTASGADAGGALAGDTAAAVPEGDLAAGAGAAAAETAAGAGGGAAAGAAAAGEGAEVGLGETVLAGLDAIPFLDIFTLAAGAGLAGAAAAKKRTVGAFKPDMDALQSGSAFQAGFGNI